MTISVRILLIMLSDEPWYIRLLFIMLMLSGCMVFGYGILSVEILCSVLLLNYVPEYLTGQYIIAHMATLSLAYGIVFWSIVVISNTIREWIVDYHWHKRIKTYNEGE